MPLRRVIKRAIVFLLLGAIVNVAVAWACSLWSPNPSPTPVTFLAEAETAMDVYAPQDWITPHGGVIMRWINNTRGRGVRWSQLGVQEHIVGARKSGLDHALHIHRAGWPFTSMGCEGYLHGRLPRIGFRPVSPIWRNGVTAPAAWGARKTFASVIPPVERPLPLRPIWPGFAINTLFYAAILWLIFAAPFALRRRLRVKRGFCPACGYPVGVSPVCTECGKPVQPRRGDGV